MPEKPFLSESQIEILKNTHFIEGVLDSRKKMVAVKSGSNVVFREISQNNSFAQKSPQDAEKDIEKKEDFGGSTLYQLIKFPDDIGKYLLDNIDIFEEKTTPERLEGLLCTAVRNSLDCARRFMDDSPEFRHLECYETVLKQAAEKMKEGQLHSFPRQLRPRIVKTDN